jgi:3-deoxy-D-manno-octulosonate 8-phosphate phosphatase (KDO 8-P phosphatase)
MNSETIFSLDPLLLEKARRIKLLILDVDGVMTDGRLYYDQSGNEFKSFSSRDGFGIKALQKFGIQVAIITGRCSEMVARRAKELGIDLLHQGSDNKLVAFNSVLATTGFNADQACFAGDDWIDIPVLDRVGLSVSVADADSVVKSRVHLVTSRAGGKGAVRELCDIILTAQGFDQVLLKELTDS